MRAGTLDQRITLQQKTVARDDWGEVSDADEIWSDVATVWANVRFLNGKETLQSGRQTDAVSASVRIRPRAVTAQMRLIHKGVIYNITAVLPGQRNEHVDLTVTAVGV